MPNIFYDSFMMTMNNLQIEKNITWYVFTVNDKYISELILYKSA